jgi:hypothetical protein
MRTTVILDEELRKKLKMLSVQKDISMKEIITQALEEKIQREMSGATASDEFGDNPMVNSIGRVLDPVIGAAATRVLLAQITRRSGTTPRKLSRSDITKEFIELVCEKVSDIATADDVTGVRKDLQSLMKKR